MERHSRDHRELANTLDKETMMAKSFQASLATWQPSLHTLKSSYFRLAWPGIYLNEWREGHSFKSDTIRLKSAVTLLHTWI